MKPPSWLNGAAFALAVLAAVALAFRFGLDPVTTLRYAMLSQQVDPLAWAVEAPGMIAIVLIAVFTQSAIRQAQDNRWPRAWIAIGLGLLGGAALKYLGQALVLKLVLG